jgi:DNA-binding transcriptional regulator YiaG
MNSEEIKKIRNKLSLAQESFAHLLGVSVGTVNRWERGVSKPSPLAISKLKSILQKQRLNS